MAFTYRNVKGSALSWAELDENFNLVEQYHDQSQESAEIALAAANFKGNWSSLTGPLSIPASVYHNSAYWILLSNVADVTAAQPGVNAAWGAMAADITVNSSVPALKITQSGSGPALLVEDQASDTTPFVIDASGKVQVGYSTAWSGITPPAVGIDSITSASFAQTWFAYNAARPIVSFVTGGGTSFGSNTAVASGRNLGTFRWYGTDGTAPILAASIDAVVDGTPGTNDMPGRVIIATTRPGASGTTEAVRVDSLQQVGIGGTPPPGHTFRIGKNLTGAATSYNQRIVSVVQSDVVSGALGVETLLSTQAASFVLPTLRHFNAAQGAIGAGSSVTNQQGYFAESNLTGATNNFGFYGNIPAATGRWNFYAGGTAHNYFNGRTSVGTTDINNKFEVQGGGTTLSRASLNFASPPTAEASLVSSVATNSTATPQLTFHADRSDRYAAIGTYRGANSSLIGLSFFADDGSGVRVERLRIDSSGASSFTGDVVVPSMNGGQLAGLRNKIINGKMEVAQRGTSFAAASAVYTLDRWSVGFTGAAVATISQQTDVPSSNEFQSSLRVAITTADASIAAGDNGFLSHRIEGYNARDLIGRTFTLSFWVRSSKTGIHCVALKNSGPDRTYVAEYTVNAANTWEQKSITVSGGLITAGTWNWTTGVGIDVNFTLAAGSTFHTTANAWQTGNLLATSSQVNCLDTIGNIFAITGVQLEVGSVATPFEHRPIGMELALCQRYYYREATGGVGLAPYGGHTQTLTTTAARLIIRFPIPLRARPTALEQSGTAADWQIVHGGATTALNAVPTYQNATTFSAAVDLSVASGLTVGQAGHLRSTSVNNTYLAWSAEL